MADIRIVPASSIMSFTSSLNFIEKITQDASGSLNLYGSGSTGRTEILSIDGNNGRLFTISDDLSDSLFSVNTIAGLPVIEAFADNRVILGTYNSPAITVNGTSSIITGSLFGTASFAVTASFALTPSGTSGTSGINGTSGTSGTTGTSGTSGTTGTSGINGVNGTSGTSGINGVNGTSGTSGINGVNGTSGTSGINGTSGTSGTRGTSGINGVNGTSGTSGINGANGTSGTSGINGVNGTSGTSGINGVNGTSGTSGINGVNGTSGINGANGTSGINGVNGTSGTSGINGVNGTSGTSGTTGTSGTNGISRFSKSAALVNPAGIQLSDTGSFAIFRAQFPCTAVLVGGYFDAGTNIVINASKNGANLLASDLTVGTAGTWTTNTSLQNQSFTTGDTLAVQLVSFSGAVKEVVIQVDFTS